MSEVIYEGRRIRVLFLSSFFQSPWVPEKWILPFSLLFSSMTCFFKASGFSQTWTSPLQVVRSQSRSQYPTPWPMMSASEARQKGHSLNIINITTTSFFNVTASKKGPVSVQTTGPAKLHLLRQPGYPEYSGPVPARRSAVGIQARPRTYSVSARRRGFPPYPFGARGLPPTLGERRPTITRGLALSTMSSMKLFPDSIRSNKNANYELTI